MSNLDSCNNQIRGAISKGEFNKLNAFDPKLFSQEYPEAIMNGSHFHALLFGSVHRTVKKSPCICIFLGHKYKEQVRLMSGFIFAYLSSDSRSDETTKDYKEIQKLLWGSVVEFKVSEKSKNTLYPALNFVSLVHEPDNDFRIPEVLRLHPKT